MHAPLLALLAVTALSAIPRTLPHGTQLQYTGRFVAEKGEPVVTEKKFELSILVARSSGESATLYWTLSEEGRGGWTWLDRFGRLDVGRSWEAADPQQLPALLYERASGTSVVPLMVPAFVPARPLADGAAWVQQRLDHEVTGAARLADHDAWRIDVRNAYGHQRTLVVDQNSPLLLSLVATVFIGQGEEHELRYELAQRQQLSADQTAAAADGFDALLRLRDQLEYQPRTRDFRWSAERLAKLREELPAVVDKITAGPLVQVAQAAQQDGRRQNTRSGAIDALRKKLLGAAAPQPKLEQLTGEPFDWKEGQDKVVVLHFWEYRDTPLEEPYGQVAYLDFLCRQRKSDKLLVVGIAADPRLADPQTRRKAIHGVKKLKSFMNLSYPVLLDGGTAITQYGDPRVTGAKLPLFVVIGRDGKVAHYHVGHYEVDRDRGLEELDAAVTKAVGNPE